MAFDEKQTLRWGIVGCGLISSWFVSDLILRRSSASTTHRIAAIGSSSLEKGRAFVSKNAPCESPRVYSSYAEVYRDPDVDIVYIGTPHSLHITNALDAIKAKKSVLCEKPLTINAEEAEVLIDAAREKGVFFMEAVWTRFFPIASALQTLVHTEKVLGRLSRVFIDFGLDMPLSSMAPGSRTADPSLGAGALLDIGIYTLTWASLILDSHPDNAGAKPPTISSSMSIVNGVDEMTSVLLNYQQLKAKAICTSSMRYKSGEEFCRIEGENGMIIVGGLAASKPGFLIIRLKGKKEERKEFEVQGMGFHFEADAVADDLRMGRTESSLMPLAETKRMMKLMDRIRKANGLRYVQDKM